MVAFIKGIRRVARGAVSHRDGGDQIAIVVNADDIAICSRTAQNGLGFIGRPPLVSGASAPSVSVSVGASGAVISTVMVMGMDLSLVLPRGSLAVTLSVWSPSPSAGFGVKLQLPFSATFVVPMTAVPSYTVMVSPAVPLPLNTGCVASVTSLSASSPMLLPVLSVRVTTGIAGGVVSTVMVMDADGVLVWFVASVAVTVKVWSPSPNTGVVSVQLPSLSTVAVPASGVFPSRMVMIAPGSPVPLKVS